MKRTIDYKINKELIFRFYPKESTCHGFDDDSPKTWEEVHKVYYYYKILDISYSEVPYKVVFDSRCDENSIIQSISKICINLSKGIEIFKYEEDDEDISLLNNEFSAFGGVSWNIHKHTCNSYDYDGEIEEVIKTYIFKLFNFNDIGYRFILKEEQLKSFGEYLEECNEYMLKHSIGI